MSLFRLFLLLLVCVLFFSPLTVFDGQSNVEKQVSGIFRVPYLDNNFVGGNLVENNLFIPFVQKNYCPGVGESPFTLQIAGLSEFTPPPELTRDEVELLRAQEYAKLDAAFPTLVEALHESGAGWARIYIDWALIQPNSPADSNWDLYDSWLSQVATAGVKMVATISNPPSWAYDVEANPCSNRILPAKHQDFYNFLTLVINRYKVTPYNIHIWEIFNEPDAIDGYRCTSGVTNYGQHGYEYAGLLTGAYTTVKTADPSATVLMGGIAYDSFYLDYDDTIYYDGSTKGKFNRYFMDDVVNAGGTAGFDAFSIHYFQDYYLEWERWTVGDKPTCGELRVSSEKTYDTYGLDILAKLSHFINRFKTCYQVEKPVWVSETGHHGIHPSTIDNQGNNVLAQRPTETLENQARFVFTVYARSLSIGTENVTWYALKIFPGITPDDYQGLLYDERDPVLANQPKPAYYAYKALTREMDGYRFSATLTAPLDVEVYKFIHPCQGTKLIAWYNQKTGTKTYVINSVKSLRLVYRPNSDGTENQLTIIDGGAGDLDKKVNGSITISLSLEPVIIQPFP